MSSMEMFYAPDQDGQTRGAPFPPPAKAGGFHGAVFMSFMRNFSHAASQFVQGAATALPEAVDSYVKRKDAQRQEDRQDVLTAYKAAVEAGDVETMTLLEQQNPRMAPIMANLKASAKVSAQDTAYAAEMETGGFAAQYQGAESLPEVGALQRDQLQAQQRAAMAKNRVGRFGGAPSAAMPPAAPGGAPPPLDDAAIARQRLGQRDFTRGHLESLRRDADDGVLTKWTDEDMNRIAREMAEANGMNPDDPQVLKTTQIQVRELVNRNNEKAKERTAELVTRQLQNLANTKQIEGYERDRRKELLQIGTSNPGALSQEERDSIGMGSKWWDYAATIDPAVMASIDPAAVQQVIAGYVAARTSPDGKSPDPDEFDRALQVKLRSGQGLSVAQLFQKYGADLIREVQKDPEGELAKRWYSEKGNAELKAQLWETAQSFANPGGQAQGQEDAAPRVAEVKFAPTVPEEDQVATALALWAQGPGGEAAAKKQAQAVTLDRVKQTLLTGKDPNENLTPWSQQILGADLKMPGGGASLLERVSLVGGGGGPQKRPLQGQPQPAGR